MPDLQSELKKAAKVLKVPQKPLVERVWLWIKDHPKTTPTVVAKALGTSREMVQVSLTNMFNRGMVVKVQSDLKHARRGEKLWSCIPSLKQYELLPKLDASLIIPKKDEYVHKAITLTSADISHLKATNIKVEELTIVEARQLYDKLKPYFS